MIIIILVLLAKCGGDDVATTPSTTATPATTAPPTPTVPVATIAAALSPKKLPAASYQGQAAVVDGKILLPGGIGANKASTLKVWSFDPATGATTNISKLATSTNNAAAAGLGSVLYVYGGGVKTGVFDTIDSVTVGTNLQATVGKLPTPRTEGVGLADPEGATLYLLGGWTGSGPALDVLSSTDGVTFQTISQLPEPVRSPAVALSGTNIWVFGGDFNDVASSTIQRVDLRTGKSEVVGKLSDTLTHAMAFTIGGQVYVAGGRLTKGRSDAVWKFDPTTFQLTQVATLPSKLSDAAVAVVGQTAYLFGGTNPSPTNQIVTITVT